MDARGRSFLNVWFRFEDILHIVQISGPKPGILTSSSTFDLPGYLGGLGTGVVTSICAARTSARSSCAAGGLGGIGPNCWSFLGAEGDADIIKLQVVHVPMNEYTVFRV